LNRPDRVTWWVLTFGGCGASPFAPGTCGSLAAIAIGALLYGMVQGPYLFPSLALIASALLVLMGKRIEPIFGGKDPGAIVIDEVAGQWLALSFLPLVGGGPVPFICAFLLFRAFDVLKPFGIKLLEGFPDGWGVLLDDLAAGALAGLTLWGGWTLFADQVAS